MKKRIVVVGSSGTIGQKVIELLSPEYELITINRNSGDYRADMQDAESLEDAFKKIGPFDGLISTSGYGKWAPMAEMTLKDYHDGLNSKLMGQVNLVYIGRKYAKKGASFVLTSGVLAKHPVYGSTSLSMINGGIEAFVKAAALELHDFRVNAVSPSFAKETMEMMGIDSSSGTPAAEFAVLYKKALEEDHSGKIYSL